MYAFSWRSWIWSEKCYLTAHSKCRHTWLFCNLHLHYFYASKKNPEIIPALKLLETFIMHDSCCDFARLMFRLCSTHVATLRDLCCDFARLILRICATHVATLRDSCCDFARPILREHRISVAESPFRLPILVATLVVDLGPAKAPEGGFGWKGEGRPFSPLNSLLGTSVCSHIKTFSVAIQIRENLFKTYLHQKKRLKVW